MNYCREDAGAEAVRLADAIATEFGDAVVYIDTESFTAGDKSADKIKCAFVAADTVVVIIGPSWFTAGNNDLGQRRIDKEDDWVRLEIENALKSGKRIIPALVNSGKYPPAAVLPESIKALSTLQYVGIRRDYWNHDIQLLFRQIDSDNRLDVDHVHQYNIYPQPPARGSTAIALSEDLLKHALDKEISSWSVCRSELEGALDGQCIEIERHYKFSSFQAAIEYMHRVSPGCDIADHHPRWQNVWKTVTVWLTTWDVGQRVTDRDVLLAKYLDKVFEEY